MQYIKELCLTNLALGSIFMGPHHTPFGFTWDRIGQHGIILNSEYNYEDAQIALQLSFIATDSAAFGLPMNIPDWLQHTEIKYDACPINLISKGIPNSEYNKPAPIAHILYNPGGNILFIVFVGTVNICLAGVDLKYAQVEYANITNYSEGVRGHGGIYSTYMSIRNKLITALIPYLERNPQILITGHSLGGGLSQICALDLSEYGPIHYSFAAPMVFNNLGCEVFNKVVTNSYRVANLSDLVTMAPLPIMPNKDAFVHVGKLVHFQRNYGNYEKNHSRAYVEEYNLIS
ncbi:MAG: lipase family protein [Gemmatimonadales bacterium]